MSIKRIESAYAYYLDKKMSSTQMAVLQALAYSANEKNNESCYPSLATLSRLTHLSDRTVKAACSALRDMKVIDWKSGGQSGGLNIANTYSFLFPQMKMPSRKDRYETLVSEYVNALPPGSESPSPRYRISFTPGSEAPSGGGVKDLLHYSPNLRHGRS